ncbi:MAG TPA: hypothetical protein VNO21_27235 [Polyangiaceae bacterium]|nr:hypothetical protein [Polyangiaceae bacterium]
MAILVLPPSHPLKSADRLARTNEQRIAAVRIQIALVRTLLDEVERLVPPPGLPPSALPPSPFQRAASDQLADELARLGYRLLDVARELAIEKEGAAAHNVAEATNSAGAGTAT